MPVKPVLLLSLIASAMFAQDPERRVPYAPTPEEVVGEMLEIAGLTKSDVLYDLGSGDGRIVIAAAKRFGARAVGIEIDPELVRKSRENARQAGVEKLATFLQGDLFQADIREATVVALYLLPFALEKVKPKLLKELKPGARIISNDFEFGDWTPEREEFVQGRRLFLWRVPQKK
jgi:precorrin-6B methylase 2